MTASLFLKQLSSPMHPSTSSGRHRSTSSHPKLGLCCAASAETFSCLTPLCFGWSGCIVFFSTCTIHNAVASCMIIILARQSSRSHRVSHAVLVGPQHAGLRTSLARMANLLVRQQRFVRHRAAIYLCGPLRQHGITRATVQCAVSRSGRSMLSRSTYLLGRPTTLYLNEYCGFTQSLVLRSPSKPATCNAWRKR